MVLSCWAKGYHEPLYLVSNMTQAEEACRWYAKRFRIETFFSDQKSLRVSHSSIAYVRCPAPLTAIHSRVSGLYLEGVLRFRM